MADQKITELTAKAIPTLSDLLVIVDDPTGTPVTKKATIENVLAGLVRRIIVSSNQTIDSGAANLLTNINGLSFAVTSGKTYFFRCHILFSTGASTTGSRWTINAPEMTLLAYMSEYTLTATTTTRNAMLSAIQLPTASNATSNVSNGGGNIAQIEGIFTPSADGTLQIQGAREVTTDSIIIYAGSFLEFKELI